MLVNICQSNLWDAADFLTSFQNPDDIESNGFDRLFGSSCSLAESVTVERDGNFLCTSKRNSIVTIPLELYTDPVDQMFHVRKAVQYCSRNILAYPMRSKNRGVLFLVNIIETNNQPDKYRNGAILDKMKLITLFREFGFKIFYYENVTLKEFRYLVDELIKSKYLRATDCLGNFNHSGLCHNVMLTFVSLVLVFCVLSHGCFKDGHQMIQFSDGKNGSIEDVIVKFSNRNCPHLRRKPKLFIFPMCR